MWTSLLALAALAQEPAVTSSPAEPSDPRLWLEDVTGEAALDWVRARNAESQAALASDPAFAELKQRLLTIYDSKEKIPYVSKRGEWYYNFWQDADHPRGIWRRTTPESYLTDSPEWDVILDVDALNKAEGENWVWDGAQCLRPDYNRCLIALSRGGADATVTREFDVSTRAFVKGGFELQEAKGMASWIDLDHVYVGTDFGEGSMTESGYPRIAKRWTRGTPLESAETVYEGQTADIWIGASHDHTPGFERDFVSRAITFYTNELFELRKGKLVRIDKPDDTEASVHEEHIFFQNRVDWEIEGVTYPAGSLLVADYAKWMKGKRKVEALFTPTERTSLSGYSVTRNHVILNTLEDVKNRLEILTPGKKGWSRQPLEGLPEFGEVSASAVDPETSDAYWLTVTDYLTPTSLWYGEIGQGAPKKIKQVPEFFDAAGLTVSQHFAKSKDGTQVPYFQVGRKDLPAGGAPTLLYGYGGFEVSLLPGYNAGVGAGWLERGGVYVVANIRGGGEYGPRWHQAALKENRHRAYEDFVAVGEDLVRRGVTTKAQLGIMGGSNGGLLMGNMYTLYPDHWGAVVCQVPLLDMKRYTQLLAGASWAGEYGDPEDPAQWEFIRTFSPYHNIDAGREYPPILFTTSTRDDRVHPGHARKMAHALLEAGKSVQYYENIEGGHGGAANNEQAAYMRAIGWQFLWNTLNPQPAAPPAPPAAEPEPTP